MMMALDLEEGSERWFKRDGLCRVGLVFFSGRGADLEVAIKTNSWEFPTKLFECVCW